MPAVLVIDDEPSVRAVVTQALRAYSFTVLEAVGIRDAIQTVEAYSGEIQLLVVNHGLSDGFGQQAVEALLRGHPQAKVLRYSGYPREHLLEIGALSPDDLFLQKPFRARELIARVRELLGALPEKRRTAGG